jgi:hypothetical protein
VDLNARLTSSLNVQLAQSAVERGSGAQAAAASVVEQRSHRVTGTVRQIVRTRPSVRTEGARAKLDHAVAVFIDANRRTSDRLSEPPPTGGDSAQPARETALEATVQSSATLNELASASASSNASATLTARRR